MVPVGSILTLIITIITIIIIHHRLCIPDPGLGDDDDDDDDDDDVLNMLLGTGPRGRLRQDRGPSDQLIRQGLTQGGSIGRGSGG